MKKALAVIISVLFVDQAIKFYVKTHFYIGEEFHVAGNWFILHFVENNGMAFGFEFNGEYGKLFLSIFRIFAVFGLGWYIYKLTRDSKTPLGLTVSLSLIFAGALGNIIDSVFYGMIFGSSDYELATIFPVDGGYSGFLHGRVVDMFYFPIIEGHFPAWFPVWGTEEFIFFRPVFNFADASISVGVVIILLFQKKFYPKTVNPPEPAQEAASQANSGTGTQQ